MKSIIIILSAVLMTACTTKPELVKPEISTVKQVEYVIRIPPKESMEIPPPLSDINVDTAKQSDIARLILSMEERIRTLENKLIEIASFFKAEQDKLNKQAAGENKKALDIALDDLSAQASKTIEKEVKR